jgi:integrase
VRALNNASINKGLFASKRVLVFARDQGLIDEVPPLQRAKLAECPPNRSFLTPIQVEYLLRAAGQLESEARGLTPANVRYIRHSSSSHLRLARELGVSDTTIRKVRRGEIVGRRRNDIARVTPIMLYVLAGPRVSEGCDLDGIHLDLAGGRIHIAGTKTSAGDRWVPLLPALREQLVSHKLGFPFGPRDPVLATRNDRRNTPNNVTKTILNPAVARANALLEADGREPIANLTMHSLRRTFATILAICEVTQFRAKYLVGHEDYELTAKIYQQHIEVSDEDLDALERVMGCTIEDAYEAFGGALRRRSRRRVSASNLHRTTTKPSTAANTSRVKG